MRRIWLILFAGFAAFIGFLIVLANTGTGDWFFKRFDWIPWYDKIGHFVLMGTLGFLAVAAISPRLPLPPRAAMWSVIGFVLLVIGIEEWSQQFVASREFSLSDFLSGAAGVVLLGWMADRMLRGRLRNTGSSP